MSSELKIWNEACNAWEYVIVNTTGLETDPVVGTVNGIVKADGTGNISAAQAGTDFQAAGDYPTSAEITVIKQLTAAEYAALTPKVSTTLYVIVG